MLLAVICVVGSYVYEESEQLIQSAAESAALLAQLEETVCARAAISLACNYLLSRYFFGSAVTPIPLIKFHFLRFSNSFL